MSLDYAEKNFDLDQFDFIFKADDDTFAVMENLRLILLPLNPDRPSFVGRKFKYSGDANKPYMSGGAGYACLEGHCELFLSAAVEIRNWIRARGSCATLATRAALERFHPLTPEYMIGWGAMPMPKWMHTFNYFKFKACHRGCVSKASATFHYISQIEMYKMEFLLYGMSPIGVRLPETETRQAMKLLRGTSQVKQQHVIRRCAVPASQARGCHCRHRQELDEEFQRRLNGNRSGYEPEDGGTSDGCQSDADSLCHFSTMVVSHEIVLLSQLLLSLLQEQLSSVLTRVESLELHQRRLEGQVDRLDRVQSEQQEKLEKQPVMERESCPTPLSPDSGRPGTCTPSCFHGNDKLSSSKLLRFSRT
uniref:Hexosyltransferase n=1 Tax=Macrostomum lignano TaxID=282301 RepID=A0A1I8JR03_9PLAT